MYKGLRRSHVQLIGDPVVGHHRQRARADPERQGFDVEWLRLVLKPGRGRDQGAVTQAPPVNRAEAGVLIGQAERDWVRAGRQRSFDEEGAETSAGSLDRPEAGV